MMLKFRLIHSIVNEALFIYKVVIFKKRSEKNIESYLKNNKLFLMKEGVKKMRRLNDYLQFNVAEFFKHKQLMVQSAKYNEKRGCVCIDIVVTADSTPYNDPNASNIYEKFKFYCETLTKETDIEQFKPMDVVAIKSYSDAKVWGEYSNNLNISGTLIKVES